MEIKEWNIGAKICGTKGLEKKWNTLLIFNILFLSKSHGFLNNLTQVSKYVRIIMLYAYFLMFYLTFHTVS
jgi:hypothetical protein